MVNHTTSPRTHRFNLSESEIVEAVVAYMEANGRTVPRLQGVPLCGLGCLR